MCCAQQPQCSTRGGLGAWAIITKYHRLSYSNDRKLFPHRYGGWKWEMKVSLRIQTCSSYKDASQTGLGNNFMTYFNPHILKGLCPNSLILKYWALELQCVYFAGRQVSPGQLSCLSYSSRLSSPEICHLERCWVEIGGQRGPRPRCFP